MKKRTLSLLLCLILALSLMPMTVSANSHPDYIWVRNGNQINIPIHDGQCLRSNTAEDTENYSGGTEYVARYDSSTGMLYLRGFHGKIENNNQSTASAVITVSATGDYSIIVETDSSVTINDDDTVLRGQRYGIYSKNALSIGGSGKLTVNINNNTTAYGIYAEDGLSISAPLEVNGNTSWFYGLYTYTGSITLSGGAKTICVNAEDGYSCAVYNLANDSSVADNGNITVSCPLRITCIGTGAKGSAGILTNGQGHGVITLDGADVSISGATGGINDDSVKRDGTYGLVIKNSELNITSAMILESRALISENNGVSIQNSAVTAVSDRPAIWAGGAVSIKDSEVDLTANILGCANKVIQTNDYAVNTVDLSGNGFVKLTYIGEQVFSLINNKVTVGKDTVCTKGEYISDWENYVGAAEGGNTVLVLEHKTSSVMLGDVNGDGRISVADYTLVLAHVKGTKLITDVAKLKAADVNGDGKVSVADYTLILAHVKGTKLLA